MAIPQPIMGWADIGQTEMTSTLTRGVKNIAEGLVRTVLDSDGITPKHVEFYSEYGDGEHKEYMRVYGMKSKFSNLNARELGRAGIELVGRDKGRGAHNATFRVTRTKRKSGKPVFIER